MQPTESVKAAGTWEGSPLKRVVASSPQVHQERARGRAPRADARAKGLSDRLLALKACAEALEGTGEDYAYVRPRMRPDLVLWGVPEGQGGGTPPLGLSTPRNLYNPENGADQADEADKASFRPARPRNGLKGITKEGKKGVGDSLVLLEEVRTCLLYTSPSPTRPY